MDAGARRRLLDLARSAILAHLQAHAHPPVPVDGPLGRRAGAFVTLWRDDGLLRGCIGHVEAGEPLAQVVARVAVAACSADPRFQAVAHDEIERLRIEISVLGALHAIRGPAEIAIGRDGILVERGWRRGLLLPQVAAERGWDAAMFLSQTCLKAGLSDEAWRDGARLWRFEAEVFAEE
jgi:uncharacterized protein